MMLSSVKVFHSCVIFFLERNYPACIVDHALYKVSLLSQDQYLQSSENSRDKNIIPFVVEYNPSLPKIGLIINKYWDLLQLSQKDSVKMYMLLSLFWLLSVRGICVTFSYILRLMIQ